MFAMVKSDLFRRFAGGFAVGVAAMLVFQSPENAAALANSLKDVAGILA